MDLAGEPSMRGYSDEYCERALKAARLFYFSVAREIRNRLEVVKISFGMYYNGLIDDPGKRCVPFVRFNIVLRCPCSGEKLEISHGDAQNFVVNGHSYTIHLGAMDLNDGDTVTVDASAEKFAEALADRVRRALEARAHQFASKASTIAEILVRTAR
jgi:hypothetical protein